MRRSHIVVRTVVHAHCADGKKLHPRFRRKNRPSPPGNQQVGVCTPTYPVFAFAHLEHPELLPARAQHHQPLDLVVYLLRLGVRFLFLPVRPQRGDEFLPVDQTEFVVIEHVGHGVHFQFAGVEFCKNDEVVHAYELTTGTARARVKLARTVF